MPANELNFFQKHTEKIALGLGGLVLLGAGATQFLLQPNAVTIDGREVGPAEIPAQVETHVKRLQTELNKPDSVVVPFTPPAYTRNFEKLYERPVAEGQYTAVLSAGGLDGALAVVDTPDYPAKVLPWPPLATDMVIKTGHGVLADATDATDRPRVTALRQIIGDQRPADFPYVSIQAKFPMAKWRELLENSGSNENERIDQSLWSRRLAVAGVYLLRSQLDVTTGQWGPEKTIDLLPGQLGLLPENRPQLNRQEADNLEAELNKRQEEIRRAPFPALANGVWTPPNAQNRVYTAEEEAQIKDLEGDVERLQKQIERIVNPQGAGQRRGQGQRPPVARGGVGNDDFEDDFGAPVPARPTRGARPGATSRADRERERNERRLATLEEDLKEKQTELNNLRGVEDEGLPASTGGYDSGSYGAGGYGATYGDSDESAYYGDDGFGSGVGGGSAAVADGPDEVRVWAHDLTCEPGQTYRYKLVVAVINPLYRQTRLTRKQYKENYDRVALGPDPAALEAEQWSAPVTLAPRYEYFVTSGNYRDKRAEFEVWTIYDGVLERESFPELPGDEIGGLAAAAASGGVNLKLGKILLDVDAVDSTVPGGSTQIRALVLDEKSGRIEARFINEDRRSDRREELEAERDQQIQDRDGTAPTAAVR